MLARYRKFITALVTFVVVVLLRHYGYNDAALNDAVTFLGALGVYAVPNAPQRIV